MPGPPPPVEEVFQKIQQLSSYGYGSSNKFYQHRNNSYNQQNDKNHSHQRLSYTITTAAAVKTIPLMEQSDVTPPQPSVQQPQR